MEKSIPSILTSIKKLLGIAEEYQVYDADIVMHINSAFSILTQLGVGPSDGFSIEDNSTLWTDFIPEKSKIEFVKSYVHLKVKLLFDPPLASAVIECMNQQIKELEWRILVAVDPNEKIISEEILYDNLENMFRGWMGGEEGIQNGQ